jgi:crotonobetainyl-CoA:carnitine CoA-transferase CaiB-like acyl-CoA transferase
MLEASLSFLVEPFARYFALGELPELTNRPHRSLAFAFVCSDGLPLIAHLSSPPKFWEAFARALGRPDLLDDPRLRDKTSRVQNYDVIQAEAAPIFRTRTRSEWVTVLEQAGVPVTPLNTLAEVLEDPQVKHLGLEQPTATHPTEGPVRMLGFPARLSETPLDPSSAPPMLGEHSAEILAELGFDEREAEQFRAAGIV